MQCVFQCVLQCGAYSTALTIDTDDMQVQMRVAVCCINMLQCVAVRCSALQCGACGADISIDMDDMQEDRLVTKS